MRDAVQMEPMVVLVHVLVPVQPVLLLEVLLLDVLLVEVLVLEVVRR